MEVPQEPDAESHIMRDYLGPAKHYPYRLSHKCRLKNRPPIVVSVGRGYQLYGGRSIDFPPTVDVPFVSPLANRRPGNPLQPNPRG